MFDAKQILDALVKAQAMGQPQPGQAPAPASGSSGSLGDILGQLAGGQGGGGLGGLLGQLAGGGQPGGGQGGQAGGGGLGGLLGQIFGGGQAPAGETAPEPASGGGGWADTIASEVGKVAGPRAGGLVQQAIAFAKTPQGAAMLAGLASLLATKTGRQIGSSAATLGGAALVGGLTYKAMQNWQSGASPQVTSVAPPQEAPAGSGLEPQATSNGTATALVGAMIAAAAADGQVDDAERQKITGALGQVGLDEQAIAFLDQSFANPATPEQLADQAESPEAAAEIYTAARLTIDPDTPAEQEFLKRLKAALGLDDALVAHLDAAVHSARA